MDKVRWGVIGAGGIADRRTMPGICLSENAELVAFVETVPDRRSALTQKYGIPGYADIEPLLENDRVECVYVATPLQFHRAQAEAVLRAGKHLLLEKPLGVNAKQAMEIVELADQSGLKAAAGFMMRFHAAHVRMREMVQNGELGTIVAVRAQFGGWSTQTGKKWRHIRDLGGGGALMDMGIHCIDLLGSILGQRVTGVSALDATLAHTFEVEDSSCVLLRYESGLIGIVDSYFCMPDDVARIELCGTRGRIVADNTIGQVEGGSIHIYPANNLSDPEKTALIRRVSEISLPQDGRFTCYTSEVDAMCRAIRENAPVAVPLREAAEVQRIVEAAYTSSEEGRYIEV